MIIARSWRYYIEEIVDDPDVVLPVPMVKVGSWRLNFSSTVAKAFILIFKQWVYLCRQPRKQWILLSNTQQKLTPPFNWPGSCPLADPRYKTKLFSQFIHSSKASIEVYTQLLNFINVVCNLNACILARLDDLAAGCYWPACLRYGAYCTDGGQLARGKEQPLGKVIILDF